MKTTNFILKLMGVVLFTALAYSCSDDDVVSPDDKYGFVQFKLVKNGLGLNETATRAADADRLDSLAEAKKIKVTLKSANDMVEQTLALEAPNAQETEKGLWSEKCKMLAGSYTLVGYELLDNLGNVILTYDQKTETPFEVVAGGMTVHALGAKVRPRGLVKFRFVKDLSQITTRATDDCYGLHQVTKADIRIEHLESGETQWVNGVRAKIVYFYANGDKGTPLQSRLECDTIIPLKAGRYTSTSFSLYNKSDKVLEANVVPVENSFEVKDNEETVSEIPITMQETSPIIRDGVVLKKIWEALDGPNWSYRGDLYAKGANWDFNRDIDLWTAQPGVTNEQNGRVASLSFGGFGARGDMPEELGELDMLRSISLGYYEDGIGSSPIGQMSVDEIIPAMRASLEQINDAGFSPAKMDPELWNDMPREMQLRIKRANDNKLLSADGLNARANDPNNYLTAITSLPKSIGKLKKLESLFVAHCPIAEFPDEMAQLENCTDVIIYDCPNLKEIPKGLMDMPKLTMLMFTNNNNIPSDKLYEGLKYWNTAASSQTLQGLYMMNQGVEKLPDLTGMKRLALLNFANNKITEIEKAFGKKHYIRTIVMANNQLSDLPRDEEGYFADYWGAETWNFSGNKFAFVPNIFNADAKVSTIDFSNNQITGLEGGDNNRGMRAEIINLGYNDFKEFPTNFYSKGSYANYLILRGNGMKKIDEKALEGEYVYITSVLDLGENRLKELPENFNARTLPYVTGLDLSGNAFESYAWRAMNLPNIATFIFRAQRNDEGFRCMKEWPAGIYAHHGMRALLLGDNDIRKVEDGGLERIRFYVDLTNNPNLSIDLTEACPYIKRGDLYFEFSPGQDVRGCDIINPNK